MSRLEQNESKKINPIDGAEMVLVPAGEFQMAISDEQVRDFCKSGRPHPDSMEFMRPVRRVYLDAYWIYRYPVTFGQYRAFCKANAKFEVPSNVYTRFRLPDIVMADDFPICFVTWHAAASYCKWARARLPSEAEWEKAARGTDGRYFPWGNEFDAANANFRSELHGVPEPVHARPGGVSPYGAHQMCGNCRDWCEDRFAPYGKPNRPFKGPLDLWGYSHGPSPQTEPLLERNPHGGMLGGSRVIRGGGWANGNPRWAGLTTFRQGDNPTAKHMDLGFRPVLSA